MAEWTRTQDRALLIRAAGSAIIQALRDGDRGGKHPPGSCPPGSWMNETVHEQFRHIEIHIAQYQIEEDGINSVLTEDHLAHIVCRAVIALALGGVERVKQESLHAAAAPPPSPSLMSNNGGGDKTEHIDTINRIIAKLGEVIETYPPESKESIALWGFREWLENLKGGWN